MELEEQGIVSLDSRLSTILPEYKKSNKKDVTIKKMLSHYAQLRPWIPFYYKTLDSVTKQPLKKYYRKTKTKGFDIEVAKNLFMRNDYVDSIPKIVKDTELLNRLRYRYSDLPYYINNTLYNPYNKLSNRNIVPTEQDDYFRYQKVHGYVHDMGAAMQDGVGGHAGVFSNANDVAKIMQMYIQKGFYGGKRFLKSETIDKFNTCYFCDRKNRRGVGFDKPQLGESGPTCGCLSMKSFGHSGFTGTYTWADPDEELVYVLRENIRTNIQEAIYNAITD